MTVPEVVGIDPALVVAARLVLKAGSKLLEIDSGLLAPLSGLLKSEAGLLEIQTDARNVNPGLFYITE